MKAKLTGMVLAGGKSRRMGTDKASLKLDDRSLLTLAAEKLKSYCDEVVILSSKAIHDLPGHSRIPDKTEDKGPLSAIVAGLEQSRTDWNLVLTVDMPFAGPLLLETLIANIDPGYSVIHFQNGHRTEPFPGLYHRSALIQLAGALEKDALSLTQNLGHLKTKVLIATENMKDEFRNINTPGDLEGIKE